MTGTRANSILQSRTSDRASRAAEARLLADAEYAQIRDRIQAIPAARGDRTDAQQAELAALINRKYEIMERLAA